MKRNNRRKKKKKRKEVLKCRHGSVKMDLSSSDHSLPCGKFYI